MKHKERILKVLKWSGIVLLAVTAFVTVMLVANTDFSSSDDINTFIEKKISKIGISGVSIAFIKNDEVAATYQAGYADVENLKPVTDETIFQIASISKTVTATAVMQLYESGFFNLDDDINEVLPFKIIHPLYPEIPITFRMLLTHTAGLNDNWEVYNAFYTIDSGGGDSDISLEAFARGYFIEGGQWYDAEKNFTASAPGQDYKYSNAGYALLGYLVEEISGTSFPEFCQTNIFIPLEMNHTTWLLKDTDTTNLAIPYDGNEGLPYYSYATYPDGALKTTPVEYAHLLIAMMHEGQYKGKSILQPETVAEMLTPTAREGKQALAWDYAVLEEIFLGEIDNGHIAGHTGGDPGIFTIAVFNTQNKTGLVFFTNQGLKVNFKFLNINFLVKRLLFDAGLVQ